MIFLTYVCLENDVSDSVYMFRPTFLTVYVCLETDVFDSICMFT